MSAVTQFCVFFCCLMTYIGTEKTYIHVSRPLRRIFWALIAVSFTGWILALLHTIESFSTWLVFLMVAIASSVEDKYRQKQSLTPINVQHPPPPIQASPEAMGAAELVTDIIKSLQRWYGETLGLRQAIKSVWGTLCRKREQLANILATLSATELNYVLATINVSALLDVAEIQVLHTLTDPKQRLHELGVLQRAALIDALQKLGMRYQPERQRAAANVVLATGGAELSQLKSFLDDRESFHTTYKLVYSDLQGSPQQAVAMHITEEGLRLRERFQAALPDGPPGIMLKVLSDIDDTLVCSGGKYPAGIDRRLPKKCVYPGVLAFYNELDRGQVERCERALDSLRAAATQLPTSHSVEERHNVEDRLRQGLGAVEAAHVLHEHAPGHMVLPNSSNMTSSLPRSNSNSNSKDSMASTLTTPPPDTPDCNHVPPPPTTHHPTHAVHWPTTTNSDQHEVGEEDGPFGHGGMGVYQSTRISRRSSAELERGALQREVSVTSGRLGDPLGDPHTHPLGCHHACKQLSQRMGVAWSGWTTSGAQWGVNLVFLSARPESYKGFTEADSYKRIFAPLRAPGGLPYMPVLLLGDLSSAPRAIVTYMRKRVTTGRGKSTRESRANRTTPTPTPTPAASTRTSATTTPGITPTPPAAAGGGNTGGGGRGPTHTPTPSDTSLQGTQQGWRRSVAPSDMPVYSGTLNAELYEVLAKRKLSRFTEYAAIYPECCFVLVGDNGQGDVLCAEWMAHTPEGAHSGQVLGSFIHIVDSIDCTLSTVNTGEENPAELCTTWERDFHIYTSKTYIGLAIKALQQGLLSEDGLHKVAHAACDDMRRILARYRRQYPWRDWGVLVEQLNADLQHANQLLRKELRLPPLLVPVDELRRWKSTKQSVVVERR